jgi:hypothetical protein
MATIDYARLLAELGHHDECEQTLDNGIAAGFIPAFFWLAWLRYERSKTARARKEVRPLLDHAAQHGHPQAKLLLGRWMMLGKLGMREIPHGCRLVIEALSFLRREQAAPS